LSDYEAVEVLWSSLLKAANHFGQKAEYARMVALVKQMPLQDLRDLLHHSAVEDLLRLDPPLETMLADRHERLEGKAAASEIARIKQFRDKDPAYAVAALGSMLTRIRNKRVHGFKTRKGERDGIILHAARLLLFRLGELAIGAIKDRKA
jgi:hypothetical protein